MSIIRDILALCGSIAVVYGAAVLHPALGWITGGGAALGVAVFWSVRAKR